ncbi:MAG TPA: hypothetical protein PLP33_27765 [Leptospiraceae bacterium]|nr:hypothetical protein [Leptospiraceae bacterium]
MDLVLKNSTAIERLIKDKDKSYVMAIKLLLDKMRLDTDRAPYEPDVLDAMAISWKEHLQKQKVPVNLLFDLYASAILHRAKTDRRNSFCVEDMLAAWFRYKEEMQHAEQTKPYNKNFCDKCRNNSGYIVGTSNGKVIEVKCNHGRN